MTTVLVNLDERRREALSTLVPMLRSVSADARVLAEELEKGTSTDAAVDIYDSFLSGALTCSAGVGVLAYIEEQYRQERGASGDHG